MSRPLIVTHHAPDLDAIASTWLLKKFDNQHYGDAHVDFVDPGQTITEQQLKKLSFNPTQVTHVDTGLGEFDHHQPEKARLGTSATELVYQHLCQIHPELKEDKALQEIVKYTTEIDNFQEIHWDNPADPRHNFLIDQLINGLESEQLHNDESLLNFGFQCLNGAYHSLNLHYKAVDIIQEKGQKIELKEGQGLAIETSNDDTLKLAQKMGCVLAVKKDPRSGNIRIKARPDSDIEFKPLHQAILEIDQVGNWFYHNSGKMLLNGSNKKKQAASPLSLQQVVNLIIEIYG
jgi:hypothetical protein